MDHHCPILGKTFYPNMTSLALGVCVYNGNHKFFLVFLLWSVVLGAFAATAMMPYLHPRIQTLYIALGALIGPTLPAVIYGSIALAVHEILVSLNLDVIFA